MEGTLTVYKDRTGYYCQWRAKGQEGLHAPSSEAAEYVFSVSGSFDSEDLRDRALQKARAHGVPESKILEALG